MSFAARVFRCFVYDHEFSGLLDALEGADASVRRMLSDPWPNPDTAADTLERLISSTSDAPVQAPAKPGGLTLLTSGTSGTPKGAPREKSSPLFSAQLLDRVPRRRGEACYVAAPVFHGTGLGQAVLSLALGNRLVLRRRFDPEATLRAVQDYRCDVLVVVPTMLQRILALPDDILDEYDTSSLRIIFASGSAMAPDLVIRALARFGPVLYNLYGSTELAVMTVAMPEDLAHNPATAGRPPVGCRVALYDDAGHPVTTPGAIGRIFAGNMLSFSGYTDGRTKEVIDGLLSSGDVGHFDGTGRLYVDGRDDDMIISGGENVYPLEVENLIAGYPDVARGRGGRGARSGFRAAAQSVCRAHPRALRSMPRTSRVTCAPISPGTRCPARWSSGTNCPATRPANCCAAGSSVRR